MHVFDTLGIDRRSLRFLGLFAASLTGLGVLFEGVPSLFQQLDRKSTRLNSSH